MAELNPPAGADPAGFVPTLTGGSGAGYRWVTADGDYDPRARRGPQDAGDATIPPARDAVRQNDVRDGHAGPRTEVTAVSADYPIHARIAPAGDVLSDEELQEMVHTELRRIFDRVDCRPGTAFAR